MHQDFVFGSEQPIKTLDSLQIIVIIPATHNLKTAEILEIFHLGRWNILNAL